MIRFTDAAVLAYTKLRVHRIRTGIAVTIAALLFGLMGAIIIVAQGVFTSVEDFNKEGLNDRTILAVGRSGYSELFNAYDKRSDVAFVNEVEAAHKAIVEKKKAAAKRYSISYDAALQDPSPIAIDDTTKQRVISDAGMSSEAVGQVVGEKHVAQYEPFAIDTFTNKYSSAKEIQSFRSSRGSDEAVYMKDGKEKLLSNERERFEQQMDYQAPRIQILDGSVSEAFVVPGKFDATKGEIPVIIPFSVAEKALGKKPLDKSASNADRLERLAYVRENIDQATASFCYRNEASSVLLMRALGQAKEMKAGAKDKNYVKPKLIYKVPTVESCGAVTIESDTRSAAEKKLDDNQLLYEKEIGTYLGEPAQKKINVRGVGVSSDPPGGDMSWSLSMIVQALLGSSIGEEWFVPTDLLAQLPVESRPDYLFKEVDQKEALKSGKSFFIGFESYLVEFGDKEQARAALAEYQYSETNRIGAMPFGSSSLVIDEAKNALAGILKWALLIIAGIAIAILAGIIGRTVAEGRRESAIFRAIGASRADIATIYGMYVVLLSTLVVLVSAAIACVAALTVQILYGSTVTIDARLAYAASDTSREFLLYSFTSPYLLVIIGVIIASSIIASIIPVSLGARRNPIKDMRNE